MSKAEHKTEYFLNRQLQLSPLRHYAGFKLNKSQAYEALYHNFTLYNKLINTVCKVPGNSDCNPTFHLSVINLKI